MKLILVITLLALAACSTPEIVYKSVSTDIPVSTPCHAPVVTHPEWATSSISKADTLFAQVRALLVTENQRQSYEAKLEAANKACN